MNKKIVIVFVLALAGFFRIWQLTLVPTGFNADEAALGYNAYSILETGKDEFGNFLPIAFTSFGDYKPPLYVYLTVPFVAVLGLTELAVRLPSAIFGTITVLLVFLICRKLFGNYWISIFGSLFLALAPWHIHYSRGGWETNLFTFLLTLGIYLFILSFEKIKYLYLSAVVFSLSFYSYQGARLIMPLTVLLLSGFYLPKLLKIRKQVALAAILSVMILLPALMTFITGSGFSRFSGVSIFADEGPFWQVNQRRGEHQELNAPTTQILHNKAEAYAKVYLKNYMAHFDPDFLFVKGDQIPRNKFIDHGTLLLAYLPFILLGIYFLIKKEKNWPIVFLWLLAAPSASALTFQSPQALRSASMTVPISMIAGVGFYYCFNSIKQRSLRLIILIFAILFLTYNFVRFWHYYTVHNPKQLPIAFQPGFAELVPFITSVQQNYDKVIITDRYDQPYILFLFYQKPDPGIYQGKLTLTARDKFGFSTVRSFDNLEFKSLSEEDFKLNGKILYVGTQEEIDAVKEGVKVIKIINFPNGKPAFEIVEKT